MNPVIISAALTGVAANREQCPALPYTPAQIAAEALRAAEAGAAIVHIHGREDDGRPSWRVEDGWMDGWVDGWASGWADGLG